jgi:outer membrane protein assembly factor BamB
VNVRWKVALPGRGLSNPVIVGGKVFITASSGPKENRLHVLCFESATGKKLWERTIASTGQTLCHEKTCMAAPTPVADGKAVYALFATFDLVAYDVDGNLLWYRSLTKDYPDLSNQVGAAASPVLHKDVLLVPMDTAGKAFVAGIDTQTGKNRWKTDRAGDNNWTTPLVLAQGDKAEVLLLSRNDLTAYDVGTGNEVWSYKGKDLSQIPSPAAGKDTVYVPGRELVSLKPGSDKQSPTVAWKTNKLQCAYSTPLPYQDRLYTINGAGVLNSASAADGKVQSQLRLKGPFGGSPVAGDGKIYATNETGATFVIEAGPEPKLLATNEINDTILATPALADGAVFLRSDRFLYCFGKKAEK